MEFKPPPKANLPDLLDCHISGTYGCIKDGVKDFRPMLLVQAYDPVTEKDEYHVVVVAADFNTWAEKKDLMRRVGREYYDRKLLPIAVALASEAWVSREAGETGNKPGDCDDRREVIFVAAQSLERECQMRQMPIKRDREGKIIQAPFIEWDDVKPKFPLIDQFFIGFAEEAFEKIEGRRR